MRLSLRSRFIAIALAACVLIAGAALWVEAVERWVGQQLRSLAADHLNPTFDFDDLIYSFPRSIRLRGARLTSPLPEAPGRNIAILAIDSLSLTLSQIPAPNAPFDVRQLALIGPTLRLVRASTGEGVLGFSDLLKDRSESAEHPATKFSERLQVREASIEGGRVEYDPRHSSAAIMLVEGITARLLLTPEDAGTYGIDFLLDHRPVSELRLRGQLLADEERLEAATLSFKLEVARAQDHYFAPAVQSFLAERDITGRLGLEASGALDFDDFGSSQLQAQLELSAASYAVGGYGIDLDHFASKISIAEKKLSIDEFELDSLGGHVEISGKLDLADSMKGDIHFEGAELQIGDLLRGKNDADGVPLFSGMLDFSGDLRGSFSEIGEHAEGAGQVALRKARVGRLPVLATIDEALDSTAEVFMKREQVGHAELRLDFSFEGNRAEIAKLHMNDRWYGLRGHGDVFFDQRLDLAVDGGPIQRVENELGRVGDLLGEITETLVHARVTGALREPEVDIELLRQRLP